MSQRAIIWKCRQRCCRLIWIWWRNLNWDRVWAKRREMLECVQEHGACFKLPCFEFWKAKRRCLWCRSWLLISDSVFWKQFWRRQLGYQWASHLTIRWVYWLKYHDLVQCQHHMWRMWRLCECMWLSEQALSWAWHFSVFRAASGNSWVVDQWWACNLHST